MYSPWFHKLKNDSKPFKYYQKKKARQLCSFSKQPLALIHWPMPQLLHLPLFKGLGKTNGLSNVQPSRKPWKSKGCFLSKYELQSHCPLPQRRSMKMLTIAYAQYSLQLCLPADHQPQGSVHFPLQLASPHPLTCIGTLSGTLTNEFLNTCRQRR